MGELVCVRKRPELMSLLANLRQTVLMAHRTLPPRFYEAQMIRHDTITQAWRILTRRAREEQEVAYERMYAKMKQACSALKRLSPEVYEKTLLKDPQRTEQLFPPQLRLPVDTPPNSNNVP